ncbi:glycerol-3-phosphate dehydrogenase/oxidase [Dyadobacter sp. CY323]|uniref:glycerol-3-phosphate dehydrogenase/oxidase n=1 Tax=Dyadobacter sp. CY323 TaxID=2907302 RepID=UPI001F3612C7|nr:glycerol-3-phosphate dehydrogenase/oxidase [Dyadobacter sp. CY323]MCE6991831.1 glycerol-3-phosphate dehydrogenase/oxidase [Dyadobacter sp. CY323]
MTRSETIQRFRDNPRVPVLIVGAGINGAGLFRELALNGIDALLIDKSDIAAGASSAPSRMIHGGLRYLENREVRLVKESLKERNLLLKNAPHYVKPLPTVIPIFQWFSGLLNAIPVFLGFKGKSVNRGGFLVKIGLSAYDFYTRKQRVMPTHRFQDKKTALQFRPALNPAIVCTAMYYDAWISYPERLCLELCQDALASNAGSGLLNYCSLAGSNAETGEVYLKSELTGGTLTIRPDVVVNATGAWIDFTNASLQAKSTFIGGTKGSHLMINNAELMKATQGQMLYYENSEGRICILFPLHGNVLVGSTDIKITNPEEAVCTDAEVAYMLESIRQVFPDIKIDPSEIVFRFSGVRPLPHSGADITAQISRDHSLPILPATERQKFPVYSMIGGKWTTFRAFASHTTEEIAKFLNLETKASSEDEVIGGGRDFPAQPEEREKWIRERLRPALSAGRLEQLLERYGTNADHVISYLLQPDNKPLRNHPQYSTGEMQYLIENEFVEHLDDLVLRRTSLGLRGELSRALLQELGEILMQSKPGLAGNPDGEIERTLGILNKKHGVNL